MAEEQKGTEGPDFLKDGVGNDVLYGGDGGRMDEDDFVYVGDRVKAMM
jgi:hypothetical protein